MPRLNYYRQRRRDGGTRSGVAVDDAVLLHSFEPGAEASDPALLWYVDIRCEGPRLPARPDPVRQWLLAQRVILAGGLRALAEELRAGVDVDVWPLQRPIS